MRLAVVEVQFGSKDCISGIVFDTAGERYANMRSAMYGALRSWLKTGAIPADPSLRTAMLAIRYTFNIRDEIQLVPKTDLLADHPDLVLDDLDALALTFGGPLALNAYAGGDYPHPDPVVTEYDPFSPDRMAA